MNRSGTPIYGVMGTYRYQKSGHWLCRPTDEVLEPWPPRLDHAALPPSHPAIDIDRKDICVFSELRGEKNGFQATKKKFMRFPAERF